MKRWTIVLAVLSFLMAGCARGTKHLGTVTLIDGSIVEGVQHKSLGHSGPNVTRVESWRYDPETQKSEFVGESSGHASGAVETAIGSLGNVVPAAVGGVLAIEAARAFRPGKTDVNVNSSANANPTQTGASATANPTMEANPTVNANPTMNANPTVNANPTINANPTVTGGTVIANPSTIITGATATGGTATGGNSSPTITGATATGGAGGSGTGGAGGTATNTNRNCGGTTVNSSCN